MLDLNRFDAVFLCLKTGDKMSVVRYNAVTLTKDEWLEVFASDIATELFWGVVKILYSLEDHRLNAKCLAEILGTGHFIGLNRAIGHAGHMIYDRFAIQSPPLRSDKSIRWWNIVFDGEDVYSGGGVLCYWILKREMLAALEEWLPAEKSVTPRRTRAKAALYPVLKLYDGLDGLKGGERKAVVAVRRNQGKIRKLALRKYGGECAVCGMKMPALLTASHIKSWANSTPEEKGDSHNILLLCPTHDALFDKHLITFLDDGTILINEGISKEDREKLCINGNMKISVDEEMKKYLADHRQGFEKKQGEINSAEKRDKM